MADVFVRVCLACGGPLHEGELVVVVESIYAVKQTRVEITQNRALAHHTCPETLFKT